MERTAAIVLAGGQSRRMGRDKASVVLAGRTLLQRVVDAVATVVDEVIVVGAPGRDLPVVECARPLRLVSDPVEAQGPLAGLIAGLEASAAERFVVVACDQPLLDPALLRLLLGRLEGASVAVPVIEGRPQPLGSAVRHEVLPALQAAFAEGERAARVIARLDGAVLVSEEEWRTVDPTGRSFVGVNTPEELARAESRLREGPSATEGRG